MSSSALPPTSGPGAGTAGADVGKAPVTGGRGPSRLWAYGVAAGVLAGLVAWGVQEATLGPALAAAEASPPRGGGGPPAATKGGRPSGFTKGGGPPGFTKGGGPPATAKKAGGPGGMPGGRGRGGGGFDPYAGNRARQERREAAYVRVSVITNATLGAALGLALGLASGLAAGSARRGLMAGVAGLALGGAAGAAAAWGLTPVYYSAQVARDAEQEPGFAHIFQLLSPGLVHAGSWAAAGIAAGLALGLGLGARGAMASAALGGVLGAAIAAVLYLGIRGLAFPFADEDHPIADSLPFRLLTQLIAALLVALGATWAAMRPARERPRGASAATKRA